MTNFLAHALKGISVLKPFCAAILFFGATNSFAIEFEGDDKKLPYQLINGIEVISLGEASFSVVSIPESADDYEISPREDTRSDLKSQLKLGEIVSKEEAINVLEIYYKHNALDENTIKIRNLIVGQQVYATWCIARLYFWCTEYKGKAGTYVTYEVNGENIQGGKTGFRKRFLLIRKFSSKKQD